MAKLGNYRVDAKELKEAQLLLRRPRVLVGRYLVEIVSLPFVLLYCAIALHMTGLIMRGQWDSFHKWKLGLYALVILHITVRLLMYWSVKLAANLSFKAMSGISEASDVLVVPNEFSGHAEIIPIERRHLGDELEVGFVFRKQRFCYNEDDQLFRSLQFPDHEPLDSYRQASGLGTPTKVATALARWGPNQFDVPLPPFSDLLMEHLLAPFFCFQTLCVALWALDEYWYYSLFTLMMLVTFECTVVMQRLRNLKELRTLSTPKQTIQVYREGKWANLPGDGLLPGDMISIGRPTGDDSAEHVVPADCLLLSGTAIVEEAVLTGESTPQWKNPLGSPDEEELGDDVLNGADRLDIQRDKAKILFGGTRVLQHTGASKAARIRTPDGGCLAVVLRTGFDTSQGLLMRTILHSTERVTANNWETGMFILFLLFFAIIASGYVLYHGLQEEDRSRFKLFLHCTMIITSVIPPELPMELSIAINASLLALARKRVFCTEPFRIVMAGKVDVCCFDKTGTLTSNDMLLQGIAGLPGRGADLEADVAKNAGPTVLRILAGCQSLVEVDGSLVGDPLELAAFAATGWKRSGENIFTGADRVSLIVEHRYAFTSVLKRMAAVVRITSPSPTTNAEAWLVAKGAPEIMQPLLADAPADYESSYKQHASQGSRIIALAYKTLPGLEGAELRRVPRGEAESGLTFAGFAVFACPLKSESEPSLRVLKESSHQLVMITGDTPLTACFAAGRLHIIDRPVLIATHRGPALQSKAGEVRQQEPDSHFQWLSPDETCRLPFSRDSDQVLALARQYDLCLGGDSLQHIENIKAAALFIPLIQVFARTSPQQKELILKVLRSGGATTLMCGDGTNDVGALKAAHVGVALLAPSKAGEKAAAKRLATSNSNSTNNSSSRANGDRRQNGEAAAAGGSAGPNKAVSKRKGAGTKMLEGARKKGQKITPKLQQMADWMDSLETTDAAANDGVPMVKPGDASMAAPFTAKDTAIGPVCDIIKQGRCTLVTTVQMFKILGLLCLSTAYSLSVMYLEGVKLGDLQATTMGILSAAMFFVLSNSKPLEKLSRERPHPNIWCVYVFASLLGQFLVHVLFLAWCYSSAKAAMPEGDKLTPDADFKPNLVNTVCFLVNWIIQITTFAVNYVGHPFNTALKDNKGLWNCIKYGWVLLAALLTDFPAGVASWFSLVPLPGTLTAAVAAGAVADFACCYAWEGFLRQKCPAPRMPSKGWMRFVATEQLTAEEKDLDSTSRGKSE